MNRLFFLKIINLISFLKGLCYHLIKPKYDSFSRPSPEVVNIGFFDSSFLIHVKEPYTRFFSSKNLFIGGSYKPYKIGVIDLAIHKEKVLIKKTYMGSYKSKMKFYNEIECLDRLSHLKNIPKVFFVDYEKLVIYLEYIEGDSLQIILGSKQDFPVSLIIKIDEYCKNALSKIHENNIAVIDIQPQNIIYNSDKQDVFFIDFADSVCSSFVPKKYLRFLQNLDELYLSKRVLSKLT